MNYKDAIKRGEKQIKNWKKEGIRLNTRTLVFVALDSPAISHKVRMYFKRRVKNVMILFNDSCSERMTISWPCGLGTYGVQ